MLLKDSKDTEFLSSRLKLFQSLQVVTANDLLPSVIQLNLGQIKLVVAIPYSPLHGHSCQSHHEQPLKE